MATQPRRATTVRLTRRTYDALQQRAQRVGKDADALADEILQKAMHEKKPEKAESEREQMRRVLREEGLLIESLDEYQSLMQPGLDFDAGRAEMAALHLDPPLSETIIRERHEQ